MKKNSSDKHQQIKEAAESDLLTFIRLVAPHRVLGAVHEELIYWWTRQDAKSYQLALLPRGHQKSAMVAYYVAWLITVNPAITVLYVSATSTLAEKQVGMVKDILLSPIYRRYWPEMVNELKGQREKWSNGEFEVDHPKRKEEGIRDPTVFAAGLTTTVTGLHCDVMVLDDMVVKENAYTEEGRKKVEEQYSLYASIQNPGAKEIVVGTRYHPKDLYEKLKESKEEIFDESGEPVGSENLYEVFERVVEDSGDGRGEFLWPRQRRSDGTWFGFNTPLLMKIKAKYLDKTQFYAQYYNDPNDRGNAPIDASRFLYYDRKNIMFRDGRWYYKNDVLNVFAAIDFAYSTTRTADWTAIAIVGVDSEERKYILDIERLKTDKMAEYAELVLRLYLKWEFKKLRAETTAAQRVLVRELSERIKASGHVIKIEEHTPTRHDGNKEERINAILAPAYDNQEIIHYKGGNCQVLEEELVLFNPPHDDVKDAVANAVKICIPPKKRLNRADNLMNHLKFNSRFGGVSM